jgi:hypothetical protein
VAGHRGLRGSGSFESKLEPFDDSHAILARRER